MSDLLPLRNKRIVVTGATGLLGRPLCSALAKENEVVAAARFGDPATADALRAERVEPVGFDLQNDDLSVLPASADVVFHLGASTMVAGSATPEQNHLMEVNVRATGRLLSRYRSASAFVYASSGAVYAYQGGRPVHEEDPLALLPGLEDYSMSKIAAEQVVQSLAREWRTPTVILRIVGLYSERGGLLANRVDKVARGEPVAIRRGAANETTAMYETDFVEKIIRAPSVADVPPRVLNFTGTQTVTVPECCRLAGELLRTIPRLAQSEEAAHSVLLDTTRMQDALGATSVGVAEGIARVVEAGPAARLSSWSSWGAGTRPAPAGRSS
ncbi:hypothetical protein GCM10009836_44340 [Pseudonocardia ailaonensis]|uniref:NAD-dependent epimerase/dehydratase domain-containing protein n=1 Tax=Pseudonocardia ailaonensis TaxID=367279 RepID=A0ABN2N9M9_9PSEU